MKSAIHVLLDMTGVSAWTWFLAATYLADVHNHTWNAERNCIPSTARDGITRDISRLLQFIFWERVLYLDHVDAFPESKERAGYFVGCSPNVGDELTYRIYDDQSKQLINCSVVRPYHSNKRVRWDPMFDPANLAPKTTASDKICTFPSNYSPADDMDQYDMDEPDIVTPTFDPDQFYEPSPSCIKKFDSILRNPDICLTLPSVDKMLGLHLTQEDPYSGDFLLRFSPKPVALHPALKKTSRVKRRPSSTISYPTVKLLA